MLLFQSFNIAMTMNACCHVIVMSYAFHLWLLFIEAILDHCLTSRDDSFRKVYNLLSGSFLPLSSF